RTLENARMEARTHGLLDAEIANLERGGTDAPDTPPVRRILERNRLWTAEATALLELLPEDQRTSPFVLAVLGELAGSRRLRAELPAGPRSRPPPPHGLRAAERS